MTQRTIEVDGMACGGCEETVTEALTELDGVESADADHEAGTVAVVYEDDETDTGELSGAIEDAGYEVVA
ncbi:copper chaperone [Natronoarchaeum philippinense]|uniref:Copper chaperone n=1 Tax=Natronoarchaeum philippinense TaxID=558529 RepID=A0A285NBU3_NATPI|nr:heavy-metal-associated domain-containing protein [Natronoarchaeum philippinense]SNZ06964.1 copper chaperone [Natronoarchaeum philippinense]